MRAPKAWCNLPWLLCAAQVLLHWLLCSLCCSIGLELVADPILLFLDEPTSGLDSTASKALVVALQARKWVGGRGQEHELGSILLASGAYCCSSCLLGSRCTLVLQLQCPTQLPAPLPAPLLLAQLPTLFPPARHGMTCAQAVARGGVTAAAVIHQPSYECFSLFDDLLLLGKGGRTVYGGPQEGVQVGEECWRAYRGRGGVGGAGAGGGCLV